MEKEMEKGQNKIQWWINGLIFEGEYFNRIIIINLIFIKLLNLVLI